MKPIWTIPITLEEINHRCRNTLCDHLGIEFIEIGDDHMAARMPVDKRTHQPFGSVHGGATAALAETVGSVAGNCCIDSTKAAVGLDLNINHIRGVKSGFVTGIAKPLHLGKTTQVWDIRIYNEAKQLISAARLTIAILAKG